MSTETFPVAGSCFRGFLFRHLMASYRLSLRHCCDRSPISKHLLLLRRHGEWVAEQVLGTFGSACCGSVESPAMYVRMASSLPRRAMPSFQQSSHVQPWRGSSAGKFSGFQTWQPSLLRISGPGNPLDLARGCQFGDADDLEELVVRELGGGLRRPLALIQRPERCGGEARQAFSERKLACPRARKPFGSVGSSRTIQ